MLILLLFFILIICFCVGFYIGDRSKGTESRVMQAIERDGIAAVEWMIEKFKKKSQ